MTLGELIDQLKAVKDKTKVVLIQPGNRNPAGFDSWRGSYDELALGYGGSEPVTVKQLLKQARAANGKTFNGWKGGEFVMDRSTPVWIDNPGEYHEQALEIAIETDIELNFFSGFRGTPTYDEYQEIAEQFGLDAKTIQQIHMAIALVYKW